MDDFLSILFFIIFGVVAFIAELIKFKRRQSEQGQPRNPTPLEQAEDEAREAPSDQESPLIEYDPETGSIRIRRRPPRPAPASIEEKWSEEAAQDRYQEQIPSDRPTSGETQDPYGDHGTHPYSEGVSARSSLPSRVEDERPHLRENLLSILSTEEIPSRSRSNRRFQDGRALRDAFLLSELLAPPLARRHGRSGR